MEYLVLIGIGVGAGILAGLFGIGGGVVIVPALVLLLKMEQHTATGTSLVALLLPVGLLGVWSYIRAGNITGMHVRFGLLIAAGLVLGTYLGAQLAEHLSNDTLRKLFAVFLLLVSVYMFVKP
jgi:uncharacterized membrane protein YfcA